MKLHFYLRYGTKFGETFSLLLRNDAIEKSIPLNYFNETLWRVTIEIDKTAQETLQYSYIFTDANGKTKNEGQQDRVIALKNIAQSEVHIFDYWNAMGAYQNVFFTMPFQQTLLPKVAVIPIIVPENAHSTHLFKVKAPILAENQVICLLGNVEKLGKWTTQSPILMQRNENWWTTSLAFDTFDFPVAYKYGIYDVVQHQFIGFEEGENRVVYGQNSQGYTILQDGFVRLSDTKWRGAGVAIPVFSLRSEKSLGVGEFTDINFLVDWAKKVGMKLIQLLPINDTNATGTWTDSYPYAAISAFAFHPIYVNIEQIAGKNSAILKAAQTQLNALDAVDYEAVLQLKLQQLTKLYLAQKEKFLKNKDFQAFFHKNKHWLVPYSAFSFLRNQNKTSDFNQWTSHATYHQAEIEAFTADTQPHFDEIAVHYFTQYHLHLQLQAATKYAHENEIIVKGDIPIGIYRYSCDAWVEPALYNMQQQAGAPPDDFAIKGQNWGFPTYNWAQMQADDFAWWRKRFEQMGDYFDAFRIDHILGFFRIWSIPLHAVEGILGRFIPAIPVRAQEFRDLGIYFTNRPRFYQPFINDGVLWEIFRDQAKHVKDNFLATYTADTYQLKPNFATQRQVEAHFAALETSDFNEKIRNGLYELISNVILIEEENSDAEAFHFRIGMENTTSFRYLDGYTQDKLRMLYYDYFYRRQDEFWEKEAMQKLPALKKATNMLICGEDLGMVPACVPDVMEELGVLSLELQRMPKATGATFFHPATSPYLAVVTPSTHDMSTIREWWEEDRALTQRFFNEILGEKGEAPTYCYAEIAQKIIAQHFFSPAMWSIFQLQDLLSIDTELRRVDFQAERINVPANPKHYWRYRMHLNLEDLCKANDFNAAIAGFVKGSGRK
jgi:4-alpha-glucanotransferase